MLEIGITGCLPCQGIREMSGKSIPSSNGQGIVREIWSFLPCQGNILEICLCSLTSMNGATSMINIIFVLLAKMAFSDVTEGVDSKNFVGPSAHIVKSSHFLRLLSMFFYHFVYSWKTYKIAKS